MQPGRGGRARTPGPAPVPAGLDATPTRRAKVSRWLPDRSAAPVRRVIAWPPTGRCATRPARPSRCRLPARCPAATTTPSSSRSTTPPRCTGTSGWSATACWSPGRCRAGLPPDPTENHLAVHTEDHPLEYATFSGDDPGRRVRRRGDDDLGPRHLRPPRSGATDEVMVVLSRRSACSGRYVLFRTDGKNWMIHRMDPPTDPDRQPMPDLVRPMLAAPGELPRPRRRRAGRTR